MVTGRGDDNSIYKTKKGCVFQSGTGTLIRRERRGGRVGGRGARGGRERVEEKEEEKINRDK